MSCAEDLGGKESGDFIGEYLCCVSFEEEG